MLWASVLSIMREKESTNAMSAFGNAPGFCFRYSAANVSSQREGMGGGGGQNKGQGRCEGTKDRDQREHGDKGRDGGKGGR